MGAASGSSSASCSSRTSARTRTSGRSRALTPGATKRSARATRWRITSRRCTRRARRTRAPSPGAPLSRAAPRRSPRTPPGTSVAPPFPRLFPRSPSDVPDAVVSKVVKVMGIFRFPPADRSPTLRPTVDCARGRSRSKRRRPGPRDSRPLADVARVAGLLREQPVPLLELDLLAGRASSRPRSDPWVHSFGGARRALGGPHGAGAVAAAHHRRVFGGQ